MNSIKTLDEYFRDWENHITGYGYGSGELLIIPALRKFLMLCNEGAYSHSYDYRKLEAELTPITAWLLINILCHAGVLQYGTSPRNAWLTRTGERLKEFMLIHSEEELIDIVCNYDKDYAHCYPDACNCGQNGYEKGKICKNPFWTESL